MGKFKLLYYLLFSVTLLFAACEQPEDDNKAIRPGTGQDLKPTVFADETGTAGSVSFSTAGAWTSAIKEKGAENSKSPQSRSDVAGASSPGWITISPDSGGAAGDYEVSISLLTNTTGQDRTAVVTIYCQGDEMTITVTQKGTKEDGSVPQEEGPGGGQGNFIYTSATQSLAVDGASQSLSKWTATGDMSKATLTFYKDGNALDHALTIDMYMTQGSSRLTAGSYTFRRTPSYDHGTFYIYTGTIGEKTYVAQGGAVDVRLDGDTYTITLDVVVGGVSEDGSSNGTTGKLTGSYTGPITIGDAPGGNAAIEIVDGQLLTQTLFADQTQSANVPFITTGTWSTSIRGEVATQAPDWISVSPDAGGTGKQSIRAAMAVNTTGKDRMATITISCMGETAQVVITQLGKKADGTVPQEEQRDGQGNFIYTSATQSLVVDGARQTINHWGTGNDTKATVTFYKGGIAQNSALTIDMYMTENSPRLTAGSYAFMRNPSSTAKSFYVYTGTIGGKTYVANGGTVDVAVNGDVYTLTLDIQVAGVSEDGSGDGTNGKITGTYTGSIPTGGSDPGSTPPIEVENKEHLVQAVFADVTKAADVTFVAAGPWTTTITGDVATQAPDWITVSPDKGGPGKQSITAAMAVNRTGANRMATIMLTCMGETTQIVITQLGKKADGTEPQEQYGGRGSFFYSEAHTTPLTVDGAKQSVSYFEGCYAATVHFYAGGVSQADGLYLEFITDEDQSRLAPGTYTFSPGRGPDTFYFQCGTIGGKFFMPQSGQVIVSLNGDEYAFELDIFTVDPLNDNNPGVLSGSYVGYIPVG